MLGKNKGFFKQINKIREKGENKESTYLFPSGQTSTMSFLSLTFPQSYYLALTSRFFFDHVIVLNANSRDCRDESGRSPDCLRRRWRVSK